MSCTASYPFVTIYWDILRDYCKHHDTEVCLVKAGQPFCRPPVCPALAEHERLTDRRVDLLVGV